MRLPSTQILIAPLTLAKIPILVEFVFLVLPPMCAKTVLFRVLAHHQEGTCACTTAYDAALRVTVVLILEGVVEADEVVLVDESEDDA